MRYAGITDNDIANSTTGVCVSFWTQGCPHRCPGCHNPETWDFKGGIELSENYKEIVIEKLTKNNVTRDLSILGGEPLYKENIQIVYDLIVAVKNFNPSVKVYLWTGYLIEDLIKQHDARLDFILKNLYMLIDGPFIQSRRDTRLVLRGSDNQRLLDEKAILDFYQPGLNSSTNLKYYEQ